MRVKIAYTVEHSQIPDETAKFLEKAQKQLNESNELIEELNGKLRHAFSLDELGFYLTQLHNIRMNFVNMDSIFSDCQDIMVGLQSLLEQVDQQQKEQQESETSLDEEIDAPE